MMMAGMAKGLPGFLTDCSHYTSAKKHLLCGKSCGSKANAGVPILPPKPTRKEQETVISPLA
jgi:hypothetical protein